MRLPVFIAFIIMFMTGIRSTAQSIYSFQYRFNASTDPISCRAFMLKNNDGSGVLRIRFDNPGKEDVLIEMDIDEQYSQAGSGIEDPNTLIVKGINPRFIMGDTRTTYSSPVFTFKNNASNGFFEPSAVDNSISFSWQLMEGPAISKAFVSQFFSEDEDLYKSFFASLTRGLSPAEKNIRLHLLIVADTLDETIGSACAKDITRAVRIFKDLTDYLGIRFLPKIICGKQYSKANVQAGINALKPSPDDIVVFYYTGHGFRIPERPRPFPNLKLKNFKTDIRRFRDSAAWRKQSRLDNITYSMNMEDIFNLVRKKGARFNLVLSDCCNNEIFGTNGIGTKPGVTRGSGVEWNEANVRTLFLNKSPMSLLASAAQSGQKSTCNLDFGGFFSYFFKQSLETFSSKLKQNPSWDMIMQSTMIQTTNKANHTYCDKPYTPENICKQTPTYKIVFGRETLRN